MRTASKNDIEYLTQCYFNASLILKASAADAFIHALPESVDPHTREMAAKLINHGNSIVFIEEIDGNKIGCVTATLIAKSLAPEQPNPKGRIGLAGGKYRNSGIATKPISAVENWLHESSIDIVELSSFGNNQVAPQACKNRATSCRASPVSLIPGITERRHNE